jgi:stringent starvation protein B
MTSNAELPPKKDVALALLKRSTVFIHLDPRGEAVAVPPWFKRQPQLVLQIGLNMPIPIPDLTVDEQGISCTLSFNRSPHYCRIPWQSIYALIADDGQHGFWPDDVPPEVVAQVQVHSGKQQPRLRSVPADFETRIGPNAKKRKVARAPARKGATLTLSRGGKPIAELRSAAEQNKAGRPATKKTKSRPSREGTAPYPRPSEKGNATKSAQHAAGGKRRRDLPPYLRIVK